MKKAHRISAASLLALVLVSAGPVGASTVWCSFNDPAANFEGDEYPRIWIGREGQGGVWREGDSQGSATVVDGQVRLAGNGQAAISGSIIRYDDINGEIPDVMLEFTIPDFAAVRSLSETDFPGLAIGVWTSEASLFGIFRDKTDPDVWQVAAYYLYDEPGTHRYGEFVPADATRVSFRFDRVGNTVNLYTAYDGDATMETPEGFMQEGNFHVALDNYILSPNERSYYSLRVVMLSSLAYFSANGAVFIDDVVLKGPHLPKTQETPDYGAPPGPDWPRLRIRSNQPEGGAWLEAGDRLELRVDALTAVDPPQFQWLFNGAPLSGMTSAHYVKDAVVVEDTGVYNCRIWNSQAKTELLSDPVAITVAPAGSLPAGGIAGLAAAGVACLAGGLLALRKTVLARSRRA